MIPTALHLDRMHNDTLAQYRQARRADGVTAGTINKELSCMLPGHLQRMALYKVNTGCREQEVCQLRWDWEVNIPELETSLFILPSKDHFETKNSQERVVVLNSMQACVATHTILTQSATRRKTTLEGRA
jgi:integrase